MNSSWMSARDVAQVRGEGPWGDGEWPDVCPEDIPYGMPWDEVCGYWPLGDFLQAAVLAGHVNAAVMDGLVAVMKAHHLWVRESIGDAVASDAFGDAIGQAEGEASGYRQVIILLERFVDELETWAAAMWCRPRDVPDGADNQYQSICGSLADRRAEQSRERGRRARHDELLLRMRDRRQLELQRADAS